MNRYEQRAQQQRRSTLRSSMTVGTAGIALIVVVILIAGLSGHAPSGFYSKSAIGLAILLLIFRQVGRRLKSKTPRAAEPDPRSTLKLD
jgi:uncharacterized membrane protein YbjE (DUF340 family)